MKNLLKMKNLYRLWMEKLRLLKYGKSGLEKRLVSRSFFPKGRMYGETLRWTYALMVKPLYIVVENR